MEYTFDATNKKLGRLATEVADVLRGKNTPHYAPNRVPDVRVIVNNLESLDLSPKKMKEEYTRYTGYPGGLRYRTRQKFVDHRGWGEMFRKTVRNMLPDNRLRDQMLKNLFVNESEVE